jgi:hypothetical protein
LIWNNSKSTRISMLAIYIAEFILIQEKGSPE